MAALITSAYMAGKKVHVSGEANGDGLPFAVDIRVGAKAKTPKDRKMRLPVRIKGPVVVTHRAA